MATRGGNLSKSGRNTTLPTHAGEYSNESTLVTRDFKRTRADPRVRSQCNHSPRCRCDASLQCECHQPCSKGSARGVQHTGDVPEPSAPGYKTTRVPNQRS